ncbi:hypothetical protein JCGZ_22514 [Jatropha curcas]|uniref:Uncharacterized protein n=1 Tax=Jatropha curcas TaxID=180498 RepID=A0A067JPJ5_JATCU|nr:hypothetical protein JCGZ_22514 [Jatropha curcas]
MEEKLFQMLWDEERMKHGIPTYRRGRLHEVEMMIIVSWMASVFGGDRMWISFVKLK